ncbi:hypothetical protein [Cellulomonas sp. KRMCY2]|nr:hypothetical protein [Cellulomonas sp. KRMCY2]
MSSDPAPAAPGSTTALVVGPIGVLEAAAVVAELETWAPVELP